MNSTGEYDSRLWECSSAGGLVRAVSGNRARNASATHIMQCKGATRCLQVLTCTHASPQNPDPTIVEKLTSPPASPSCRTTLVSPTVHRSDLTSVQSLSRWRVSSR
eukprot:2316081-Rhodomonas_salina.7